MPLLLAALAAASGSPARPAEDAVVRLPLDPPSPRAPGEIRLLPDEADLRPGNAAVVLLRMPWEQGGWMREVYPRLRELSILDPDDPRLAEVRFDGFASQMQRAAGMREADWCYPLEDGDLSAILLPDVQGLRAMIGWGMPVWISQRIAAGDPAAAREGVATMIGCSRHVARTPLFVPQVVASATGQAALDQVERLIARGGQPSLRPALARLPDELGDGRAAARLEGRMLERSLPSIRSGDCRPGDAAAWTRVMEEYLRDNDALTGRDGDAADRATRRRALASAARAAIDDGSFDAPEEPASDDEIAIRWLLHRNREVFRRAEEGWDLPGPEAIDALAMRDARHDAIRDGSPWGSPLQAYLACHRFGRRARLLEAVEAIRETLATDGDRLPASLADVAGVPRDPLTGRAFVYVPAADRRSARLACPPSPVDDDASPSRAYALSIADR
ncbi:MAG: hypothetical protein ACKO5R_01255 [Planctomycetaceae bacterium]